MAEGLLGSNPIASGTDVPQNNSVLIGTPFDMEGAARAWRENAARVAQEARDRKAKEFTTRQTSPFVSISNPTIRKAISNLFNESTSPATLAPAKVTALTRNPGQATKINALGQQMDTANQQAATSLTEFVKQQLANRPVARRAAEQEVAASEAYYTTGPGSVQQQLADQARNAKAATREATRQAMNTARRGDSVRRMRGGNSSYNDYLYGDALARIAAEQSVRESGIDREDLKYLLEGRRNQTGVRSKVLDDLARRELDTGTAYRKDAEDRTGLLSSLLNLENANTEYRYEDPETRLLRNLGLIGGLTDLDYAQQRYEMI